MAEITVLTPGETSGGNGAGEGGGSLMSAAVAAGFPSPADDYAEGSLDLNQLLVKRPAATFFVRVSGDSMIEAGIHDRDLLVVDRSLEPADGAVVIAVVNGELTVKRLRRRGARLLLLPANPRYRPLELDPEGDNQLWGVVTHAIHEL
ncbi:MAG TPA: translesion error-prone DNA polymerase V autoproteolytic subunit [candidate division Zixibacteria bacterium]|nr:translesion error-prone DNA polymerase V autoproteolytic subunit [candidate division Zixibacteria bacterium]